MWKRWCLVGVVVWTACGAAVPKGKPRDERLPAVMVDLRGSQRISAFRVQEPGELLPNPEDVAVALLDAAGARLEVTPAVTVATTSTVEFEFEPQQPGNFELVVDWGAPVGTTTRPVHVVEVLDGFADVEVTYQDRMDGCFTGVWRLPSGRVFCERGTGAQAYTASGVPEFKLDGFDVVVTGDEVWLSHGDGLEHHTELEDGGLRFDGRVYFSPVYLLGETRAGRAVRGTGTGVVEVTFDGGTLAMRTLDGFGSMAHLSTTVLLEGDTPVLGAGTCSARRGCVSDPNCRPVLTCLGEDVVGVTDSVVWTALGCTQVCDAMGCHNSCTHRPRERGRLSISGPLLHFSGARAAEASPFRQMSARVSLQLPASVGEGSLFPTFDGTRSWYRAWRHSGVLVGASNEWLVAVQPNVFTLRFHRMPPEP